MGDLVPAQFEYDNPGRALVVTWSDGEVLPISFTRLRLACPCAECIGEGGRSGRFSVRPGLDQGEDELADIALVGRYGLNVVWANGHRTGIYTHQRLRELGEHQEAQAT